MSYVNKDCDVTRLAILRERGGATCEQGRGDSRRERGGETRAQWEGAKRITRKVRAPTESVKNSEQNHVTTSNASIGYFHLTDMRMRTREPSL